MLSNFWFYLFLHVKYVLNFEVFEDFLPIFLLPFFFQYKFILIVLLVFNCIVLWSENRDLTVSTFLPFHSLIVTITFSIFPVSSETLLTYVLYLFFLTSVCSLWCLLSPCLGCLARLYFLWCLKSCLIHAWRS